MQKESLSLDSDMLKRRCADPLALAHALGLADGARRQRHGLMVRCPWHAERNPSCSLTVGADSTLRAHCFGCGKSGDVFTVAAAVLGLDARADFVRVVQEVAARCALSRPAALPIVPRTPGVRRYPPDAAEVWARCGKVYDDRPLRAQLQTRCIDAAAVTMLDLARVLPAGLLPRWCRAWQRSGHRLVLPLHDERGNLASLHGRILAEQQADRSDKGRFPTGYTNRALVMADTTACDVLATGTAPWWSGEVLISEGATDFLTLAIRWGDSAERMPATIGIYQGAWSVSIAARIPNSAAVRILTDPDEAGRRYAAQIRESLSPRKVLVWKESRSHG